VLGYSSEGWPIETFRFGTGQIRLVFIGGIHGGYEWNTILLAYEVIDYFSDNPEQVPPGISLYIIPSANPDGQAKVVGHAGRFSAKEVSGNTVPGRLNSLGVDLNRNWDCNWESKGFWLDVEVSGGDKPFSEPETQILREFLTQPPVAGVVFWHSAVPATYAGGCDEVHNPSVDLAEIYAEAAGYPFEEKFLSYPVTGSAIDWLATQDIPAIEVELSNHTDIDWEQNIKAVSQTLDYFQNKHLP
jgi:murein tripeptide amidase MpaA